MPYTRDRARNLSFHARYEVLRAEGVQVGEVRLGGKDLDEYVDRLAWDHNNPGVDPVEEIVP
jgi:hypothetical protein